MEMIKGYNKLQASDRHKALRVYNAALGIGKSQADARLTAENEVIRLLKLREEQHVRS